MVGVNLRIVPAGATRAGKASVTKTDAVVPALSAEERAAVAAEGGGLGLLGPTRRVCLVCKARASAYSCPRCATPYCSAACYKGHNQGCTEGFYRRHVEGEMHLRDAEGREQGQGKKATIEALKRVRLEGEGTGDDWLAATVSGGGDGVEEEGEETRLMRLAALAEAGELELEALTPAEQQAFMRAVASGQVGRGLDVWKAWWEGPPALAPGTGAPLVVEEGDREREGGEEEETVDISSLWRALEAHHRRSSSALPPTASVAAAPSPLLRYHLLDVLFAYAAVLRTYNGQWRADPPQAAADLLRLSAVLAAASKGPASKEKKKAGKGSTVAAPLPCSAGGALASSLAALHRWDGAAPHGASSDGPSPSPALAMGLALARDVSVLVSHGTLVACALLDAYFLVRAAMGEALALEGHDEDEDGDDLAALAAQLEGARLGTGEEGEEEDKERGRRRQEGRRLLRVLHKLRFLLAWADGQQQQQQQDAEESWLLPLRAEVLVSLQEHEAVVAAGGGWEGRG